MLRGRFKAKCREPHFAPRQPQLRRFHLPHAQDPKFIWYTKNVPTKLWQQLPGPRQRQSNKQSPARNVDAKCLFRIECEWGWGWGWMWVITNYMQAEPYRMLNEAVCPHSHTLSLFCVSVPVAARRTLAGCVTNVILACQTRASTQTYQMQ